MVQIENVLEVDFYDVSTNSNDFVGSLPILRSLNRRFTFLNFLPSRNR